MHQFCFCAARGVETNFGPLDGGWLRIAIPKLAIQVDVLGYASDAVIQATEASHSDFEGLAGLPLLRMSEYGGDRDFFWMRTP
jgi:hypothetical protein